MDFSRITRTHVWIIGGVVILLSCVLIYFAFITRMAAMNTAAATYNTQVTSKAATYPTVHDGALAAKAQLEGARLLEQPFLHRNPTFHTVAGAKVDLSNPVSRWQAQQQQEELQFFGGLARPIQQFLTVNRPPTLKATAAFGFPVPPTKPGETFAQNPLVFKQSGGGAGGGSGGYPGGGGGYPGGSGGGAGGQSLTGGLVSVDGTYSAVMQYIRRISACPRLVVIEPVTLDSADASTTTVPARRNWVHAEFYLSIYEFVRGVPEAGAGGGAPGGGAPGGAGFGAAGYPGGYPGGGSSSGGYPGGGSSSSGYPGGSSSSSSSSTPPAGAPVPGKQS